jgi:uncharacterized membrane protein (Fun14 family)
VYNRWLYINWDKINSLFEYRRGQKPQPNQGDWRTARYFAHLGHAITTDFSVATSFAVTMLLGLRYGK